MIDCCYLLHSAMSHKLLQGLDYFRVVWLYRLGLQVLLLGGL